jgi:lipopolysaccharide export system protein LptC
MNSRSVPIMPLAILALLGGLTFWLSQYVTNNPIRNAANAKHEPDVIIEKFTARKLSPTGDVQYVVIANKMTHFADDDSAVLENVVFTSMAPGQPTLTARAPMGRSFEGGARIVLEGGVVIESAGSSNMSAMTLRTPRVTVLPDENIARSTETVTVESAQGDLRAASFELNNLTQVVVFSRAKLTLTSPRKP